MRLLTYLREGQSRVGTQLDDWVVDLDRAYRLCLLDEGNESELAVAAITFFNNILWMLFAFNTLVGPGSVAVISRRYGEKDFDNAERAIKETILLKLIFGAALGLFGYFYLLHS